MDMQSLITLAMGSGPGTVIHVTKNKGATPEKTEYEVTKVNNVEVKEA